MRIALLTEGGYPYARGESVVWCDRLVRGLSSHEFDVYALSRGPRQEDGGWVGPRGLPSQVRRVRTARLWGPPRLLAGRREGWREGWSAVGGATGADRFAICFGELARALCVPSGVNERAEPAGSKGSPGIDPRHEEPGQGGADRFANALYGLARWAAEYGGLADALCSEVAVRVLEDACRTPGALRAVRGAQVADLLAVVERLERALRPLSLDWYGASLPSRATESLEGAEHGAVRDRCGRGAWEASSLAEVDLCHAVGGGLAALPGLLAKRAFGTPLLITEYGVRLREHYLSGLAELHGAPVPRSSVEGWQTDGASFTAGTAVRSLLGSFQRQLAAESYRQADVITPGNTQARSWQEHCGADRRRLRTVYPGMDSTPFLAVTEDRGAVQERPTLVWVGRATPEKDVIGLLRAFAEVRKAVPAARLLVVQTPTGGGVTPSPRGPQAEETTGAEEAEEYVARCQAVASELFEDEPAGPGVAEEPVTFVELGAAEAPTLADAYAGASVVLLSRVVEGFPLSLVEAMFCGRATVSTDAGAVCEVIGGTGLVVPPGEPRALADAALALLHDPLRRARLGAAARERARELFTVEQNVTAFHGIYLELLARGSRQWAAAREHESASATARPFARTAESQVGPGSAAETSLKLKPGSSTPSWARTVGVGSRREERR